MNWLEAWWECVKLPGILGHPGRVELLLILLVVSNVLVWVGAWKRRRQTEN